MARKFATASTVGRDELTDFVRPRHRMVLITFRSDDFDGRYVQIDGAAEVVNPPET